MGSVTRRIRRNIEENLSGFRGNSSGRRFKSMTKYRQGKVKLKKVIKRRKKKPSTDAPLNVYRHQSR